MHPPFSIRLGKNFRGITLTSIKVKIYNALPRNRIEPKITTYVLTTCLEHLWIKSTKNLFKLIKERSRRYLAKTITDADYADDIALLANAPAQAETNNIVWNEPLQHRPLCQWT